MNDEWAYDESDEFGTTGELVPIVLPDSMDRYAWERMFHTIPQEQLEVLVCLYLGLKPVEIVKVLQYPNIVRFYNVSAKLRDTYRKQKEVFL